MPQQAHKHASVYTLVTLGGKWMYETLRHRAKCSATLCSLPCEAHSILHKVILSHKPLSYSTTTVLPFFVLELASLTTWSSSSRLYCDIEDCTGNFKGEFSAALSVTRSEHLRPLTSMPCFAQRSTVSCRVAPVPSKLPTRRMSLKMTSLCIECSYTIDIQLRYRDVPLEHPGLHKLQLDPLCWLRDEDE